MYKGNPEKLFMDLKKLPTLAADLSAARSDGQHRDMDTLISLVYCNVEGSCPERWDPEYVMDYWGIEDESDYGLFGFTMPVKQQLKHDMKELKKIYAQLKKEGLLK